MVKMKYLIVLMKWLKLIGFLSVLYAINKTFFSALVNPLQLVKLPPRIDLEAIRQDFPHLSINFADEKTDKNRNLITVTVKHPHSCGTILVCNGQSATIREDIKIRSYCKIAAETGYNVLGFDYAGTGNRKITSWSYRDLVHDGVFLAQKITKELSGSESLIIKGNSLGGAIAILVTKFCHDIGILAYLWSGKSFASTSSVLTGQLRTLKKSGHYETPTTIVISNMAKPLFSGMLLAANFEMDIASAYQSIPDNYKNYFVIRSARMDRANKKDDAMIPYCASLEGNAEIKLAAKLSIKNENKNDPQKIDYYRARRKCFAESAENAHGFPDEELFCRTLPNLTVNQLFCLFATQYIPSHKTSLCEDAQNLKL